MSKKRARRSYFLSVVIVVLSSLVFVGDLVTHASGLLNRFCRIGVSLLAHIGQLVLQGVKRRISLVQIAIAKRVKRIKRYLRKTRKSLTLLRFPKIKFRFPKMAIAVAVLILIIGTGTTLFLQTVPDPKNLNDFQIPAATLIYDRNNTLLYSAYDTTYRIPISLSKVPKTLRDATIAAEDKRFYKHHGFDFIAVLRSLAYNIMGKELTGGSTITQQLAKNVFLTKKRSISRKIKEIIIAIRLEQRFTKDQILELYFNTVSYGGVTQGVESASLTYFGKPANQLTDKEAIFLATLPAAPSVLSQVEGKDITYPKRITYVLNRMVATKLLTKEKRAAIQKEALVFTPRIVYKRAPHAVDYVLKELEKNYGKTDVLQKGLIVQTTIDLGFQNYVQQAVLERVAAYKASNLTNAAVMVTAPRDGIILAMVGSANYYDDNGGQFNVVTAKRQLGSTLKIVTYAQACEEGATGNTTIVDSPVTFRDFPGYKPKNYDNKFHGTVTLRSALANSYNIPALKLAYQMGLPKITTLGTKMGITEFGTFQNNDIPLSLAIGGVEISLEHLSQAYSVVANDGSFVPQTIIEYITDHQGKVLYKRPEIFPTRIISSRCANELYSILSDANARSPMFGRPSFFDFGQNKVAIKTGTSNDVKDNVAVAFSPDFVVSVWVGNNNGEAMYGITSGYAGASEIMHEAAMQVIREEIAKKKQPLHAYEKSEGR